MSSYTRVKRVLIGSGTQVGTSLATLTAGDLLLLDESGTPVTTSAAAALIPKYAKVTIAAGLGNGQVRLSSPIQGNSVSAYTGKAYAAPVEQSLIVGYNGTTGTGITSMVNAQFRLRINIKDSNRVNGERMTLLDTIYPSDSAATAAKISAYIAKMFDQKDYGTNYAVDKVKLERVSNGTFLTLGVAIGGTGTPTLAVVNGSATATASLTTHGLVVGDYVRIGGTGAGIPVYVVSAVNGATITLDTTYKGATATVANASVGRLTSGTVTEFGFLITGLPISSRISTGANQPFDTYTHILFDASFANIGSSDPAVYVDPLNAYATKTNITAGDSGEGHWKLVADDEEASKGWLGDTSKRRVWDIRVPNYVTIGGQYQRIDIDHADIHLGNLQDNTHSPLKTTIYIPTGTNQAANTTDNFKNILNSYFSTVLGFTAIATTPV